MPEKTIEEIILEEIRYVRERLDGHLAKHNGIDMHEIKKDVDMLKIRVFYVAGIFTATLAILTFLKEAILAWIGRV